MTTTQTNLLLGQRGQIFVERNKLAIEVQIVDARSSYGRQEVMIQPTSGLGRTWVQLERVNLK